MHWNNNELQPFQTHANFGILKNLITISTNLILYNLFSPIFNVTKWNDFYTIPQV